MYAYTINKKFGPTYKNTDFRNFPVPFDVYSNFLSIYRKAPHTKIIDNRSANHFKS